jgi:hypothetical protein
MVSIKSRAAIGVSLLLLWSLLFTGPVQSDAVTANEFVKAYSASDPAGKQSLDAILGAMEDGMGWYKVGSKIKLYCLPDKLALTGNQIFNILRRQIAAAPNLGTMPYGLAVLLALEQTFPCS